MISQKKKKRKKKEEARYKSSKKVFENEISRQGEGKRGGGEVETVRGRGDTKQKEKYVKMETSL